VTVAVIGAGPAGVSAVTWLGGYGVDVTWLDASGRIGGMLWDVHNAIDDYPAFATQDGAAFAQALSEAIPAEPTALRVREVTSRDGSFVLRDGSAHLEARALILATGTRKRRLGVPGEAKGMGQWVRQSAARDAREFQGSRVAVVGGGDSAVEGSILLAENGAQVHLIARSPLGARAAFQRRLAEFSSVEVSVGRRVLRIEPNGAGCRLTLDDGSTVDAAALFVRIGVEPVLPEIEPQISRDAAGFVVVDDLRQTSVAGVFAAGDVTDGPLRSIATAVADGAVAARSAAEYLEKS